MMVVKSNFHKKQDKIKKGMICLKFQKLSSEADGQIQFKRPNHECTEFMKEILWRLATRQLKTGEWRRLAYYWRFKETQIKAIEHQYTGN